MADTPININVGNSGGSGGSGMSFVTKLCLQVACGYLACVGYTAIIPERPTLPPACVRWVEKASKPIVDDLLKKENKGDAHFFAVTRFSNDPSGQIAETIRQTVKEKVLVADKTFLEKIVDTIHWSIDDKTPMSDNKARELGKYAKSNGIDAVIWGNCTKLEINDDKKVEGEIHCYLVGQDGSIIYDKVYNNDTLYPKSTSTSIVTSTSYDSFLEVNWPHRLLIWTLIVLAFPILTIGYLKSVAKKRSNGANAFTLFIYTAIGGILAYLIFPPVWSNIYSTLIFVGMVLGACIYNLLIMDFARKLELE